MLTAVKTNEMSNQNINQTNEKSRLEGMELLKKIEENKGKSIRELAIICGYSLPSLDNQRRQIVKALRKQFIQAVIDAGGDVNLFWLDDPYNAQQEYLKTNREKKAKSQLAWREKNIEKVRKSRQTLEAKLKNNLYGNRNYRKKNEQKQLDKIEQLKQGRSIVFDVHPKKDLLIKEFIGFNPEETTKSDKWEYVGRKTEYLYWTYDSEYAEKDLSGTKEERIDRYKDYLQSDKKLQEKALKNLKGKALGIWWSNKPYQAQILADFVNDNS